MIQKKKSKTKKSTKELEKLIKVCDLFWKTLRQRFPVSGLNLFFFFKFNKELRWWKKRNNSQFIYFCCCCCCSLTPRHQGALRQRCWVTCLRHQSSEVKRLTEPHGSCCCVFADEDFWRLITHRTVLSAGLNLFYISVTF